MMTKKYTLISLLLFSVVTAACRGDDGESADEQSGNQTMESEHESQETGDDPGEAAEETATEEDASGGADEETIDRIIEKAGEVGSYEAIIDLEGAVDGSPYALNAEAAFQDGDPPDLLLKSNNEARTVAKDGEIYIYTGEDWVETTESMNIESLFLVTYESTVNSLENLSGNLRQEEKDGAYIFTYEGTNQAVFQEFEDLLGFGFGTMDTSNVHSDLRVAVDKDDYLLQSIDYEASGEDEYGEYSLSGDVAFMNFNEVDAIELPEGIEN
ncbi:DUF6612 family protein [Lacicoccus alkaliphilus]|uniref:Lipoprotein n=1 Tax=Lacicoccus alkaliphilus DSM 16010 TaxID=1123231 RepID=A0A1M7IHJ1_9BACL|nr:DUF6612 family protein [Salinicoccus alkaliphilus]SHM40244.1 hypothetical protein SAMN02745189_02098 [Salinicoccus alkaliphilus DSM 16010]